MHLKMINLTVFILFAPTLIYCEGIQESNVCSNCPGIDYSHPTCDRRIVCGGETPLCMTSFYHPGSNYRNQREVKRCASVADCLTLWWNQTLSQPACMGDQHHDPYSWPGGKTGECHYCCYTPSAENYNWCNKAAWPTKPRNLVDKDMLVRLLKTEQNLRTTIKTTTPELTTATTATDAAAATTTTYSTPAMMRTISTLLESLTTSTIPTPATTKSTSPEILVTTIITGPTTTETTSEPTTTHLTTSEPTSPKLTTRPTTEQTTTTSTTEPTTTTSTTEPTTNTPTFEPITTKTTISPTTTKPTTTQITVESRTEPTTKPTTIPEPTTTKSTTLEKTPSTFMPTKPPSSTSTPTTPASTTTTKAPPLRCAVCEGDCRSGRIAFCSEDEGYCLNTLSFSLSDGELVTETQKRCASFESCLSSNVNNYRCNGDLDDVSLATSGIRCNYCCNQSSSFGIPCNTKERPDDVISFLPEKQEVERRCIQCGVTVSNTPCGALDLLFLGAQRCPPGQEYCMNSIYLETDGQQSSIYKRCVDKAACERFWTVGSALDPRCVEYDPSGAITSDVTCHFCCSGDNCNERTKPSTDTLWVP